MIRKPFGFELLLDLYACNPITVDDKAIIKNFLEIAVETLKVHKQADALVIQTPLTGADGENWYDKRGLSAWIPLVESGIQIHTLVEKNFVAIDYFTCSEYSGATELDLIELAVKTFDPKHIDKQFIWRGKKYYIN